MTKLEFIPDSELEVMLAIWDSNKVLHTGEIMDILNPERTRTLQALQVLLSRLVDRGFLTVEKIGRLNYFTPVVTQQNYTQLETSRFVKKLYKGSPTNLIASLVGNNNLTEAEIAEIRELLEKEERHD